MMATILSVATSGDLSDERLLRADLFVPLALFVICRFDHALPGFADINYASMHIVDEVN